MARISERLYEFAQNTFERWGFGNQRLLGMFAIAAVLSLLAVVGFYLPALAELMDGLMSLTVGGGTFLTIALLTGNLPGIIFAAVAGLILAALSTTICSIILFLAPPVAALFLLPNLIAGVSFVLGGISSVFEACFCCNRNTRDYEPDFTPRPTYTHETRQSSSTTAPSTDSQPGMPGNAFFDRLQRRSQQAFPAATNEGQPDPYAYNHNP